MPASVKEDNIWNFKSQSETGIINSVVIVKTVPEVHYAKLYKYAKILFM